MTVSENPIATGIIGAVIGALLTAGGFMVFAGDEATPPAARELTTEEEEGEEAEEPEVEPKEIASGIQLSFKKGSFTARVTAADEACVPDRVAAVLKQRSGKPPLKVGSITSDSAGIGVLKLKNAQGTYFARLGEGDFTGEYGELNVCLKALSNKVKV